MVGIRYAGLPKSNAASDLLIVVPSLSHPQTAQTTDDACAVVTCGSVHGSL